MKKLFSALLASLFVFILSGCQEPKSNSPLDVDVSIDLEAEQEVEEENKGIQYIKDTNIPTVDSIVKDAVFMDDESSSDCYYYDLDDDYETAGKQVALYCAILEGEEGWALEEQTNYDSMIKFTFKKNNVYLNVGFANLEGNYVCMLRLF